MIKMTAFCNPTVDTLESIGKVLCIPFTIISFLSLDINSIPENRRGNYLKTEPAIIVKIEDFFLTEVEC